MYFMNSLIEQFFADEHDASSERELRSTGAPCVQPLVLRLRNCLREHRSLTKTREELDLMRQEIELKLGFRSENQFSSFHDEDENVDQSQRGMSVFQQLKSEDDIKHSSEFINSLGLVGYQALCSSLNSPDRSLAMTTGLIIHEFNKPTPYIVKSIVASPHLHLEISTNAEVRIMFYLLLSCLAHSGDDLARRILKADSDSFGATVDEFDIGFFHAAIYLVSASK